MTLTKSASRAAFARIVGVSGSRATQLVQAGVLKADGTLGEWIQAYCAHLRTQASGRTKAGTLDLSQERALLAREQRRVYEIKRLVDEGALISVETLKWVWGSKITVARNTLLNMGSRLGVLLAAEDDPARCADLVDDEVYGALEHIAGVSQTPLPAPKQ